MIWFKIFNIWTYWDFEILRFWNSLAMYSGNVKSYKIVLLKLKNKKSYELKLLFISEMLNKES